MASTGKRHPLVGAYVTGVGMLPGAYADAYAWDRSEPTAVLTLSKGVGKKEGKRSYETIEMYAARDPELNGPGTIFGERDGAGFYVFGSEDDDKALKGLVVMDVRPMNAAELDAQGWRMSAPYYGTPSVLVLSDRSRLFPSMDAEGNGPGIWVVKSRSGDEVL